MSIDQKQKDGAKHTPGPWIVGQYEENLGYDCMTGGIRVGPICLDGSDYGQVRCKDIEPEALNRMLADARLIAAAPDMVAMLIEVLDKVPLTDSTRYAVPTAAKARAVIAKALGIAS